jgi:hypothetical protein
MTKEQILSAIAQAAENGLVFDVNAAFISKVKERNAGGYLTFWVGTQAQYNALASIDKNCMYIITDSTRDADIERALRELSQNALTTAGGTMVGGFNMNGNNINMQGGAIQNLPTPVNNADAANKKYVDDKKHSAADITSGTFDSARLPTVPIAKGGTGATTAAAALQNMGAAAAGHKHSASDITNGTLSIARGGTGATNGAAALQNMFAAGNAVLSSYQYGDTLPSAGTKGRIFFKKVN